MIDEPDPDHPTRPGGDRDPSPLSPRAVGLLMLLWTAVIAAWFALTAANGTFQNAALVLAVASLFGVIWLFGLIILVLFLAPDG